MTWKIFEHSRLFPLTVKSQVPKASSRDKLERVKAKLSVVTLLLPKVRLRSGIITHESDNDEVKKQWGIKVCLDILEFTTIEKSPNKAVQGNLFGDILNHRIITSIS